MKSVEKIGMIVVFFVLLVIAGVVLFYKPEPGVKIPEKKQEKPKAEIPKPPEKGPERSDIIKERQVKINAVIKQLEQAIASKNDEEIRSIINSLDKTDPFTQITLLNTLHSSQNTELQSLILKIIGSWQAHIGIDSVKKFYLKQLAEPTHTALRRQTILVLSLIGGRKVCDDFIDFLKQEPDAEIRKVIGECLTVLGDVQKIDDAIKANQDNSTLVQELTTIRNNLEKK